MRNSERPLTIGQVLVLFALAMAGIMAALPWLTTWNMGHATP